MSIKDEIIKLINAKYRQDPYINDFTQALNICFQRLIDFCESIKNNQYFDKLDDDGIKWWESYLKIIPLSSQSKDDRRATIQAKYLSNGHNEIALIQRVCDAWKNGETDADFVNGKIQIEFVGEYGVPNDMDSLRDSIDEIKPAHLPVIFLIKYLLIEDIHEVKTVEQMENLTIDMFTQGKDVL